MIKGSSPSLSTLVRTAQTAGEVLDVVRGVGQGRLYWYKDCIDRANYVFLKIVMSKIHI